MARYRRQPKYLIKQKVALGIFGLLALVIVVYLATLMLEDAPLGEFVEGKHYSLLEKPRRIRGNEIEVMEFFSYACAHCYNFEPDLEDWVDERGDKINFIRVPVAFSESLRKLARHYYAMESLGLLDDYHLAFFRAIHEKRQTFNTVKQFVDFFPGGLAGDASENFSDTYRRTYNAPEVSRKVDLADQMARRLRVTAVPTIIIQGKYLIRTTQTIGPKRMLEVMDYLVDTPPARQPAPEPTPEPEPAAQEPNL